MDGREGHMIDDPNHKAPGSESIAEMAHVLEVLVASGRRVVGFDLVEVAPGEDEWDANVGARVLYKLCGAAVASRRVPG